MEERGRREMKSIVLKLLENNCLPSSSGSVDSYNEIIYGSCRSCLDSILILFKQAAEPEFSNDSIDCREPVVKQMALEADNLHGCRSFDRKVVEEGIGRTILTLPLRSSRAFCFWLGSFPRLVDNCPNLQRAFQSGGVGLLSDPMRSQEIAAH
ncbi:hypothetical protein HAX54_046940 [Datura stramonium]|uniref:At3g05675-like ankyrin-like domain-containing protein n=1 Tax=Datura stramonium TaxID=4076 RepID=A0ABS8RQ30_DATST|nr:hypothetical protein [Datura stramonium]